MARVRDSEVSRAIAALFGLGSVGDRTDGQLLELFLARREGVAEAAFEALVARHGPMVLDVCRHVLGDPHDAQDAFQATFLVLARQASSIRRRDSVGSWLYGVARRVASRARREAARRRTSERRAVMMSESTDSPSGDQLDFLVLHEEIDRLPEKYRAPVVLCYLEGMTQEQAASHLRCPVGTVGVRLMRARERLRSRLTRRGLALPVGLVTAGTVSRSASAAVPPALVDATVGAVMHSLGGKTLATGIVSAFVCSLTDGILRTMLMDKMKLMALTSLSAGLLVTGGGLLLGQVAAQPGGGQAAKVAQGAAQDGLQEPRPPTPREQFEALLKKYDAPRATYINDRPKAKDAAAGFLRLAREHPDDPIAVEALRWVVEHTLFTPMAGEAMGLLAQDQIASERLGPLLGELGLLYGAPFEPLERLLREALARNPHREVRGRACLGLADYLREAAEDIERRRLEYERYRRSPEGEGRPFVAKPEVKEGEIERLTEESARLYERAIEEFGNIRADGGDGDARGADGTLGDVAASGLYALRHLSVGSVAPEIEGRDVEGRPFRLSDTLGKVVVLSFSANWCGPCRAMYPEERALVERLKDRPFVLLGVNADEDEATLRRLIESGEVTWRCWWDGAHGPIARRWNIGGFPTVFVIDHEGVIRYKNPPDLKAAVETLLKGMEREWGRAGGPLR